jgi:hypothetical protein
MAHLESSKLFSVKGLVAVITGAGSGKERTLFCRLFLLQIPFSSAVFAYFGRNEPNTLIKWYSILTHSRNWQDDGTCS